MHAMHDKIYWASEIAEMLEVSKSTLRKWSLSLESEGYAFVRDEHDRRCYVERDIHVLRRMKAMLHDGMTMGNAAKVGITLEKTSDDELMSGSMNLVVHANSMRSDERYLELKSQNEEIQTIIERLEQQMQTHHNELKQQITEQQRYIEESLNRRDQQLMIVLRETIQARQEIAATKKWWKFW